MTTMHNNSSTYSPLVYRITFTISSVACAFSLLVGILMATNLLTIRTASPLNLTELTQLQTSLKANPADEAIQNKIRDLDHVARSFYFGGMNSLRTGSFLLLGGVVVALITLRIATTLRRRTPNPREFPALPDPIDSAATTRWVTGGIATGLTVCALVLGLRLDETPRPTGIPELPQGGAKRLAEPSPANVLDPFEDEAVTNWPSFRGRTGSGVSVSTNLPIAWDGPSGRGILWKTPAPLPGLSSPVAWGNKVFLTGASADKREVYCYDIATGTLLWQMGVTVTSSVAKASPEVNQDTGYAASTPVTDGIFVYSIFANGDVAAIDHCSQTRWTTDLGLPINRYGYASSLALYKNLILIQFDNDPDKGGVSQVIALDTTTGKLAWTTPRPVADAWPSPILVETAQGAQLVTAANEWIIAYDPVKGTELWKVKVGGTDSASSPILAGGLVLASVAGDKIYAIRPDGHGDVTKTHVVWQSDTGISDVASPVSDGKLAFSVNTSGSLTCLEVATGKVVWDHSLEGEFYASPGLAGDKLYLVARSGHVFILKVGRQYEEIGKANLGEPSDGSPVFINGKILIRGIKNLFCINGYEK
ncbi:MAG: PQQ-binding-like beta-propeller repeat protein [bacterium]